MLITISEAAEMSGIHRSTICNLIHARKIFPAKKIPSLGYDHKKTRIMLESDDMQEWLDLIAVAEEPEAEIAEKHLKHLCEIYAADKGADLVESLIRKKSGRIYRWLNGRVREADNFEDICKMIRLKYFFSIPGEQFDAR